VEFAEEEYSSDEDEESRRTRGGGWENGESRLKVKYSVRMGERLGFDRRE